MTSSLKVVVLALAVSGCTLVDSGELTIEPPGDLHGGRSVSLRVKGPCERVGFDVDGRRLNETYPANEAILVRLDSAEGIHTLRAVALDGSSPRSAERRLHVSHAMTDPIASADPAPGWYAANDPVTEPPFGVTIAFNRPVVASRITPANVSLDGEPITTTLVGDGILRIEAARSLDELGSAMLRLSRELVDPPAASDVYLRWMREPPRPVHLVWRPLPAGGVSSVLSVGVAPSSTGGALPDWVDVRANDLLLGRLTPTSTSLAWDTTTVPEGFYALSGTTSPDFVLTLDRRTVKVDRTPPALVTVRHVPNAFNPAGERANCAELEFDEDVQLVAGEVVADSEALELRGTGTTGAVARLCPWWPWRSTGPLATTQRVRARVRDVAGWETEVELTRETPLWLAQSGSGPLAGIDPLESLWVEAEERWWVDESFVGVSASGPRAGELWSWSRGEPWTLGRRLVSEPAATVILGRGAWVERVADGPGQVHAIPESPTPSLNRDPTKDARNPAHGIRSLYRDVVWSEALEGGGRVIRYEAYAGRPAPHPVCDPPPGPPGTVADEPALAIDPAGERPFLVWIESQGGGPGQLRAAWLDWSVLRWTALPAIANVEPTGDARRPSACFEELTGGAVVWREGATWWMRRLGTDRLPQELVRVGSSPGSNVREALLDHRGRRCNLYWVEETPEGDRIRSAFWNVEGYRLVPTAVNEGVPGPVRSLTASGGLVGWLGASGEVYERRPDGF